ncbi:23S rRNA pseudouridine(2604) synthase RluF [soil metagenome]
MRLNKFISESGLCSRREADRYIEQGNVFINGKRATIGDRVMPGNKVMVNGHLLEPREATNTILIALNKPVGITSTTESNVAGNIVDFVNHSQRIFPIGRLDKDSQGLILLTNDGDIVNKILRAGNEHEKEYVVTVNQPITEHFILSMARGVPVDGRTTKKCVVKQEGTFVFRIVLIQGLNRQIRKMCEHFGYEVTKLERVRIMNISLKGIPVGEWRELDPEEIEDIYKKTSDSDAGAHKNHHEKKDAKKKKPATVNANPDNRNRFKKHGSGKGKAPSSRQRTDASGRKGGKTKNNNTSRRRGR